MLCDCSFLFFFFNDTATTEIYTLSLHDALPIWPGRPDRGLRDMRRAGGDRHEPLCGVPRTRPPARDAHGGARRAGGHPRDRKSTRLKSRHANISYAGFCFKKKKNTM